MLDNVIVGKLAMTLRWTAAVTLVAVGLGVSCGDDDADQNGRQSDGDASPVDTATSTTANEVDSAEVAHDERIDDVTDARVAAWKAHIDVFSDMPGQCHHRRQNDDGNYIHVLDECRSADNELLPATMTNKVLLAEIHDVVWNGYTKTTAYEDWELDVQSVWFPTDDRAVIETCIRYVAEDHARDGRTLDGKAFDTGTHTEQRTEELWLTDDGWKLAISNLNYHDQQYDNDQLPQRENCPIDDTEDQLTDDEAASLREDIETDYIAALTDMDASLIENRISGQLYNQLTEPHWPIGQYECPEFPAMFREEAPYKLPSFYEDAWSDVYPDVHYDNDTWSRDKLGTTQEIPSPGNYRGDCMRTLIYSTLRIGDPTTHPDIDRNRDVGTTSSVTVEDITWSDTLPVAYLTSCQQMHVTDTTYGRALHPEHEGPSDLAIRSTEALRQENGTWQLVTRWNVTYWEDSSDCPTD